MANSGNGRFDDNGRLVQPTRGGKSLGFGAYDTVEPVKPKNASAIVGFVCSILGLGFLFPLFGFLAIPFVLIGFFVSLMAYRRARNGLPFRRLALIGTVIAATSFVVGIVVNVSMYLNAVNNWTVADTTLPAPTGPQAEAAVGTWLGEDGVPWYRFDADGIGEDLREGERFNWHSDGTFTHSSRFRSWHVEGDELTITWLPGNEMVLTRSAE